MKKTSLAVMFTTIIAVFLATSCFADMGKIVIAHRGASGYLPEHTLEAKALAYGLGADYIEQDVVMTKDNKLVVMHDHYLDTVTNVAEVYPNKKRSDGRYYVIDFTLDEIRNLSATEVFDYKTGKQVFKNRFPIWKSSFKIHTLQEEIELIQGLNKSTGKDIGIYPEIKAPWFHRYEGKDISLEVLKVLKEYGYTTKKDKVYVQCFDPNETRRIKEELYPKLGIELKLVQLMAETDWEETFEEKNGKLVLYSYDWMFQKGGMAKIAEYADGVGPWFPMIIKSSSTKENIITTDLVREAHALNMEVHPYTFRSESDKIPAYASSFEDYLEIFYYKADVDGVFTDFTDKAVEFLNKMEFKKNDYK